MNITKIIVILLAVKTAFAEEEYRKFSNTKGESIEAKALSINGSKVTILRKSDNRKFTIEINNLSQIDREFLNHWLKRKTKNKNTEVISFKKINQVIGQPLFSEQSLWESSAKVVADRLKWKQESMTKFSESYRRYPQNGYLSPKRVILKVEG